MAFRSSRAIGVYAGAISIVTGVAFAFGPSSRSTASPFQATGMKIGEVTDTTAIVWTRLTRDRAPQPSEAPMVELDYVEESKTTPNRRHWIVTGIRYPAGSTVADLPHAAAGATGETRVSYRPAESEAWQSTDWKPVDPACDFTHQHTLNQLQPATQYEVRVECRDGEASGQSLDGTFSTAPQQDEAGRVTFTVSTGQNFNDRDRPDGFEIYPSMLKLKPSFFVHTGDIVYYDDLAKTESLARYHWQRTYGLPTNVEFHRQVASCFIKDDHDTWKNDCWPSMQNRAMYQFTFEQGKAIFLEQVPMGERTWRTFRWGQDLQVWLVEGRDFRSSNNAKDGPDKTIWGAEQKQWFKDSLSASDATFRVLISPTPIVGPDRASKRDNHANSGFAHEGEEIRQFLASQDNTLVVCGDRHWQYASVDPVTGLREYSCGPASDKHAGGWRNENYHDDYHRFLNVRGGFLSVTVERTNGNPKMTLRFHDVSGKADFEDVLTAGE